MLSRLGALGAALTLASALSVPALPGAAAPRGPAPRDIPQTSDGEAPGIAKAIPPPLRGRVVISDQVTWPVANGVTYEAWQQTDNRGPVRLHLLRVDPAVAGVRTDYSGPAHVRGRQRVKSMVEHDGAVAGINADFFDIRHTGAPLGNGVDRERGLLHGRRTTWTTTFWTDRTEATHIGPLRLRAAIRQRPSWRLQHLNSPHIEPDHIGVYTPAWGDLAGTRVTSGRKRDVRQVVVQQGRVRSNRPRLSQGEPVRGVVLVGRGRGADRLRKLRVGTRATLTWSLPGEPVMAISGSEVLLSGGLVLATDDVDLHPRTALGIDRHTGQLLLLVADGRQEGSRGLTLVELATLLQSLGADRALNLDGGGSSTMVAPGVDGVLRVLNAPSDGAPRKVGNALVVYGDPVPPPPEGG